MEIFRIKGEFESQSSVLVIWPINSMATSSLNTDEVSLKIIKELIEEVNVIICSFNEIVEKRVKKLIVNNNLDISKLKFVLYPAEIPYPRDFGAEVLIGDKGSLKRIDFRFDMYGYNKEDNEMSISLKKFGEYHGNLLNIKKTIFSSLISEGGDREFNGNGIMMTIKETEVDKRNPDKTMEEVEAEFKRIFNIKKIIWIPEGSYDDEYSFAGAIPDENNEFKAYRSASANGHIDEFCRFVNENTIVISYITEEEAKINKFHSLNKERLDKAYKVVAEAKDCNNKKFKIVKMPVPEPIYINLLPSDDAYDLWREAKEIFGDKLIDGSLVPEDNIKVLPAMSYCNFLICNNIVLAQKYYEEGMPISVKKKDDESFRILQEVFPNRKIIQINTLALNLYGGGIHCHTRNIPKVEIR